MQKRSAGEYFNAMELRVNRLRKRGLRSMRGKLIPENLRESHAREFAVRSWVVPSFRSQLGSELKAIILPGSVQLGVRKASVKRKTSDIDVSIVVSNNMGVLKRAIELAAAAENGIKGLMGVEVNVHVFPEEIFLYSEVNDFSNQPYQVFYGRKYLEEKFGKHFDKSFTLLRELNQDQPKYKSTGSK